MLDLLNNPIFNGLALGNSHLANGNDVVKYFDAEISPLIGLKDYTQADFDTLYRMITEGRPLATITSQNIVIPKPWELVRHVVIQQMVFAGTVPQEKETFTPLQAKHIPAMLTLTQLTNPGPFSQRTIEFGNYEGIFADHQLAAMAGQRTQPRPFIEVSAVCTHPDHHGKGYAGRLIKSQIQKIATLGCIPFLHVRSDNPIAIKLYEKLGFRINQQVHFNLFKRLDML